MPVFDTSTVDIDALLTDDDAYVRYPNDDALRLIKSFEGTPSDLVWLFRELWWGGADMVRTVNTDEDVEVTFVTVGWSGNEELLSALQGSMFDMRFWESSHRGGKQVYHIPLDSWDKPAYLGDVLKYPKPDSSS